MLPRSPVLALALALVTFVAVFVDQALHARLHQEVGRYGPDHERLPPRPYAGA